MDRYAFSVTDTLLCPSMRLTSKRLAGLAASNRLAVVRRRACGVTWKNSVPRTPARSHFWY